MVRGRGGVNRCCCEPEVIPTDCFPACEWDVALLEAHSDCDDAGSAFGRFYMRFSTYPCASNSRSFWGDSIYSGNRPTWWLFNVHEDATAPFQQTQLINPLKGLTAVPGFPINTFAGTLPEAYYHLPFDEVDCDGPNTLTLFTDPEFPTTCLPDEITVTPLDIDPTCMPPDEHDALRPYCEKFGIEVNNGNFPQYIAPYHNVVIPSGDYAGTYQINDAWIHVSHDRDYAQFAAPGISLIVYNDGDARLQLNACTHYVYTTTTFTPWQTNTLTLSLSQSGGGTEFPDEIDVESGGTIVALPPQAASSVTNNECGAGTPVAWSNPTNITTDDANVAAAGGSPTETLRANDFQFELPDDARVQGIQVTVTAKKSDASSGRISVQFSDNGTRFGDLLQNTSITESLADYVFGGPSHMWNNDTYLRNVTFLNSDQFTVEICGSGNAEVAYVEVSINYLSGNCYGWLATL